MDDLSLSLVNAFDGVLATLTDGDSYIKSTPRGPRNPATLSEAEIEATKLNEFGESLARDNYYQPRNRSYILDDINIENSLIPKEVKLPTADELDGITICGIDGSNQKVDKNSFYFILARAAVVNFKYTKGNEPPYFFTKKKDASAVTWIDGNIFKENVIEHTNNKLKKQKKDEKISILTHIRNDSSKPFMVGYDHESNEKSPSSHALGWAVKFQQALELLCLEEIKAEESKKTVCIKDGPLYSTSSTEEDIVEGMRPIIQWNSQVLACVSKRIYDSKLILETLCTFPELRQIYFPGDEVTKEDINSIGTDSLLLQRMLLPGYRTPFIKAIPIQKEPAVKKVSNDLCKDFTPLCCYYRGKTRPQTFLRIEIPFFMYQNSKDIVEEAISVVAWQHELGGKAPFIQLVADDLCQLNYEKELLERQTLSALNIKGLHLAEKF